VVVRILSVTRALATSTQTSKTTNVRYDTPPWFDVRKRL
jgi:hypothetical protein